MSLGAASYKTSCLRVADQPDHTSIQLMREFRVKFEGESFIQSMSLLQNLYPIPE